MTAIICDIFVVEDIIRPHMYSMNQVLKICLNYLAFFFLSQEEGMSSF